MVVDRATGLARLSDRRAARRPGARASSGASRRRGACRRRWRWAWARPRPALEDARSGAIRSSGASRA